MAKSIRKKKPVIINTKNKNPNDMRKSVIYYNIIKALGKDVLIHPQLQDDLKNYFYFIPQQQYDGKTFQQKCDEVELEVNGKQNLVGNKILFSIFLDYFSTDGKLAHINGRRNIRSFIKNEPVYQANVKGLDEFYAFKEFFKNRMNYDTFKWNGTAYELQAATTGLDLIRKFHFGDLIWLYYHEEMGIFKIIGQLMDDVYRTGSLPIPNDSTAESIIDANIRQFRQGLASTLSDRESTYRRSLGWQSEDGKKLEMKSAMNENFKTAFHNFIQAALEYYNEKRVIASIQTASSGSTTAAISTIMSVRDTIESLRQSFDAFVYGRNVLHTAQGIINVIAGLFMIYHAREYVGVPTNKFESPEDFIPETIKRLNIQFPNGNNNSNRYIIYRNAAEYGRDILLDIESFANYYDTAELKVWLDAVEDKVESYRTAYRNISGVELAPRHQKVLA
jgi:hypothetical protein